METENSRFCILHWYNLTKIELFNTLKEEKYSKPFLKIPFENDIFDTEAGFRRNVLACSHYHPSYVYTFFNIFGKQMQTTLNKIRSTISCATDSSIRQNYIIKMKMVIAAEHLKHSFSIINDIGKTYMDMHSIINVHIEQFAYTYYFLVDFQKHLKDELYTFKKFKINHQAHDHFDNKFTTMEGILHVMNFYNVTKAKTKVSFCDEMSLAAVEMSQSLRETNRAYVVQYLALFLLLVIVYFYLSALMADPFRTRGVSGIHCEAYKLGETSARWGSHPFPTTQAPSRLRTYTDESEYSVRSR